MWFGSVLVAVSLFSLLIITVFPIGFQLGLLVATIVALPVLCLSLPMVLILQNTDGRRGRLILFTSTLIGPVSIVLWCLLLQIKGADPTSVWKGDPLTGIGGLWGTVFALVVGFVAGCCYVTGLKMVRRRSTE
jgi:hypothetical protein